jgi:predicted nucleic acid-binding protein
MIVVADASPLIFLAKIRRLHLISDLFGGDIRVAEVIRDEALAGPIDPAEAEALQAFFALCRVEPVKQPRRFAAAMSQADDAALTLAVRLRADILLCDERVTRLMAEAEGVRPMGTLGVILRAAREAHVSRGDAREMIDGLVATHGFRIGVELYRSVLRELDGV